MSNLAIGRAFLFEFRGTIWMDSFFDYRVQFLYLLKMKVQYIDYGNTEEIDINALVEIPQNLGVHPHMSHKLMLHNTKAKDITSQNVSTTL